MRLSTLKNLWDYVADKMTEIRIGHLPSINRDFYPYTASLSICEIWVIMSLWQLRPDTSYLARDELRGNWFSIAPQISSSLSLALYEGWNFNSGNYLFTTDTK